MSTPPKDRLAVFRKMLEPDSLPEWVWDGMLIMPADGEILCHRPCGHDEDGNPVVHPLQETCFKPMHWLYNSHDPFNR